MRIQIVHLVKNIHFITIFGNRDVISYLYHCTKIQKKLVCLVRSVYARKLAEVAQTNPTRDSAGKTLGT